MKYRKLRIAWSVWWGIGGLLFAALWAHTMRNQVKAAAWITKSHYIAYVAFNHWMQFDAGVPDWEPTAYLHSFRVEDAGPKVSPIHRWYVGRLIQTGIPSGVSIRCPLWLPLSLSTILAIMPWASSIAKMRRFSLRTMLIATTLVAVGLGVLAWMV